MRIVLLFIVAVIAGLPDLAGAEGGAGSPALTYPIVGTGLERFFSDRGELSAAPRPGERFYGQDACHRGRRFSYRDNGDGTVSDLVTGLTWQKTPEMERLPTFREAVAGAAKLRLAGHGDWRLPTVKELYSLMDFNGCVHRRDPVAYLDTRVFAFRFGREDRGERLIDVQYWSATEYAGTTMGGAPTVFGVNFADGRIKGYPRDLGPGGRTARHFVRYVRGNPRYGLNRFVDNRDGTISDLASGLMWARDDSGKAMDWEQALAWCERLKLAGHDDWRLPDAKELQSLVDYTRAPDARDARRRGPAIDPLFGTTDAEGWFWSSTTHLDGRVIGQRAVYVAFGQATGYMPDRRSGQRRKMNVHGAGAQRSDPKSGDPADWAGGFGPQGDEIRILNYARAVRTIAP